MCTIKYYNYELHISGKRSKKLISSASDVYSLHMMDVYNICEIQSYWQVHYLLIPFFTSSSFKKNCVPKSRYVAGLESWIVTDWNENHKSINQCYIYRNSYSMHWCWVVNLWYSSSIHMHGLLTIYYTENKESHTFTPARIIFFATTEILGNILKYIGILWTWMNGWCFRPWFCTVKLYWTGDNLG